MFLMCVRIVVEVWKVGPQIFFCPGVVHHASVHRVSEFDVGA